MNYTLKEIATICGGVLTGRDSQVCGVVTDSRRSYGRGEQPLFVAIAGGNHDGHKFIGDLYKRGVRGFVIERDVDSRLYPEAGFVRVERSLYALQKLAADYRNSFRGTMVAVTGSSGKTTVKEWIAQLAPKGVKVFRSPRSYNSQLGVPLSILMMKGDEDVAIIEAGISRPGEMERLASVIRPDVGVFTTLGAEHGENFESPAQKATEKAKLFATCTKVIYNSNYDIVAEMLGRDLPKVELIDAAKYVADAAKVFKDEASQEDAALVACLYGALGVADARKIVARFGELRSVAMRLDMSEGIAGSLVISNRNNTDMNSLAIALDYMKSVAGGRPRVLVLFDILYSSLPDAELYSKVAEMVAAAGVEHVVGIGERMKSYGSLFDCDKEFYTTADDFLKKLSQDKIAGKAILVEGSCSPEFHRVVHQLERKSHTTVLEVDLDAMLHNLNHFRSLVGDVSIMAMVKASGYGTGNYEVANMLHNNGVDYLAVAFADEGVQLREQGITMPIVVLNADADSFELMVANRLEPEIYSFGSLSAFVEAVKQSSESNYPIHIKLDTGMHRLGFVESEVGALVEVLRREESVVTVRSIFSHLAVSDDSGQDDFTRGQIALFDKMSGVLADAIGYKPLRHIANSAAMERFPEARFDMCRLGIGLYGVSSGDSDALRPVSRLTTRIVQIKELSAGETVGYGRAGKLERATKLGTIPIGYADGLDRRLSEGRWSVMVAGRPAPIVGRVCMDSCMIDLTGIDAAEGDEVVIFGGATGNTVVDMARTLDTIPYEIMTSVSARVKRIYLKE